MEQAECLYKERMGNSLEHFPKYALFLRFLWRVFGVADDSALPPASYSERWNCAGEGEVHIA